MSAAKTFDELVAESLKSGIPLARAKVHARAHLRALAGKSTAADNRSDYTGRR